MFDLASILSTMKPHSPLPLQSRVRFADEYVASYDEWDQEDVRDARGTILRAEPSAYEGSLYQVLWDHMPWTTALAVPHGILAPSLAEVDHDYTEVTIDKGLGSSLMEWMVRTADPVFAVASASLAGLRVHRRVALQAQAVLEHLLESFREEDADPSDIEALVEVMAELEEALTGEEEEEEDEDVEALIQGALIPLRELGRPYRLDLQGSDASLAARLWNLGTDARGGVISDRSRAAWVGRELQMQLHADDVLVFMRRLAEQQDDEDAVELTGQMLESLGLGSSSGL